MHLPIAMKVITGMHVGLGALTNNMDGTLGHAISDYTKAIIKEQDSLKFSYNHSKWRFVVRVRSSATPEAVLILLQQIEEIMSNQINKKHIIYNNTGISSRLMSGKTLHVKLDSDSMSLELWEANRSSANFSKSCFSMDATAKPSTLFNINRDK
ncbi:hypothetical protein BDB01DRAFT_242244 [Pilobolus umbonatus]|nr:hypothetical protein BDB01DRAFT_242244 [Pilobolus umbonatus]